MDLALPWSPPDPETKEKLRYVTREQKRNCRMSTPDLSHTLGMHTHPYGTVLMAHQKKPQGGFSFVQWPRMGPTFKLLEAFQEAFWGILEGF